MNDENYHQIFDRKFESHSLNNSVDRPRAKTDNKNKLYNGNIHTNKLLMMHQEGVNMNEFENQGLRSKQFNNDDLQ